VRDGRGNQRVLNGVPVLDTRELEALEIGVRLDEFALASGQVGLARTTKQINADWKTPFNRRLSFNAGVN
jgi:hypothetical protein